MEPGANSGGDARLSAWSSQPPSAAKVVKFQPFLESLLDSESNLWRSPELRVVGQEASNQYCAWQSHSHDGHKLLNHGGLVHSVHDYYRNLEKNRCCLTLAGRRKVINSVRIVNSDAADGGPSSARSPPPVARSKQSRRAPEVVLAGDDVTLYQCALLSAFLPVLAAPGPPSPFTPALPTTPTDVSHGAAFSFGGATTAGDKETPALRMSAAANALSNLEKDVGSTGDLSSLVASAEFQYDRQAAKPGGPPPPALDSVTTEMLRELVRLVFKQTEQQQMCAEHDLRDSLGRRTYSEVLARHLMARLSILENNSHQFYRPTAFLCPQAYDEWVQGEKHHIKQLLNRFWHYSLPHQTRSSSSTSFSSRLLRYDHHTAYVLLLEHVVRQQESVKRHPGVPLLPTARRLLKEFALRFGVGELFCRIAYLRLLSQNMEHDVWFCRHVSVSLLAVLELLPVKPSQRTAAVKSELERLHETVATLHSHVDHALTRIHILFPSNSPPDGILSMLQLLSLVLFTQRYLTNQPGQSISHWVQRYLQDGFAWRYEYHKTVLSAELEVISAECPLTPALLNGVLVELRNEVNALTDSFEVSFKRYFSVSHVGRCSFYQLLMQDVQELCHFKLPVDQLELDLLALMFRLADLDSGWSSSVSVVEQVWREPFFQLVLSWLKVLQKHALRWLLAACMNDTWSTLTIPAVQPPEPPRVHLQPQECFVALASTPLTQGFRPTEQSIGSTLGRSSFSAFTRSQSASMAALAGSFTRSEKLSDGLTNIGSSSYQTRSNAFVSRSLSVDEGSLRHSAVLHQVSVTSDIPNFDRALSLPMDEKLSHTPVLSFMSQRPMESVSPVSHPSSSSSSTSSGPSSCQSALKPHGDLSLPAPTALLHSPGPRDIFHENLIPARPATLMSPSVGVHPASKRKNALLKPRHLGSLSPQSAAQVIPSPVAPVGSRSRLASLADDNSELGLGSSAFASPPLAAEHLSTSAPSQQEPRETAAVGKHRTAEWVASMSQSEDTEREGQSSAPVTRSRPNTIKVVNKRSSGSQHSTEAVSTAAEPGPSNADRSPANAADSAPRRKVAVVDSGHALMENEILSTDDGGDSISYTDQKASTQSNEQASAMRKVSTQSADRASRASRTSLERKISAQSADRASVERKISAQSNDSARTSRFSFSERSAMFSTGAAGPDRASSEKMLPVSSSLVDLVVVMSRLTNSIASLTAVICPPLSGHSAATTPMSTGSGFNLGGSDSPQLLAEASTNSVRWQKTMDVAATVAQMQRQVFEESLGMMSECAILYVDNMLCADLCGLPEGVADCLIGSELLDHVKSRHQLGLLWGCRHHQVAERCSNSRPSSPSSATVKSRDVRCSPRCTAGNGDAPSIEPIAAEMCTRVNNVVSLLSSYPLLHACMLERVCQTSQYPGRDSGLPFSPIGGVDPVCDSMAESHCNKVCAHIGKVLDALLYIMAHRINQVAAPCLHELLALRLPASYSLAEQLLPLTQYLSRHLSQLKACLYEESFRSLLAVLWKMIVQNLQKAQLKLLQVSKKKVRIEDEARFLLRVVAHFMQFFHCGGDGMEMEVISSVSRRLVHHLNVVAMPTTNLTSLHQRLHERLQYSSVQAGVDVQPGLVQALRNDLHALRKCFSGRDLCDWLAARCSQFGLSSSQQSILRIAQTLLSLGVIRVLDESQNDGTPLPAAAAAASRETTPVFVDNGSLLYRFVDSEDCNADSPAGQLLCSLELDRLEASQLQDSTSLPEQTAVPARNTAVEGILAVLRSRSTYDRDAKAYLTRTGTVS